MDKGSENSNGQVAVAPVVRHKEKYANNGKREAAEALEKTISAKKQKVEAEVKKVQTPPPKEEESTSTEEDTYSESEEEEKVEAEVKMVQAPPHKEEESTSTEEDAYSESEEEEKVEAEVKKVQAPPPKEEESTSTEEDTYSESKEEESMQKVEVVVKNAQASPSKEEESEEEGISMQPQTPIGNQIERGVTWIFVGNLPPKVDEDDIADLFKEVGEVIEVKIARWKLLKDNKGYCHVAFATEEAAKRALEMNQQEFMGFELRVQLAKPRFHCEFNEKEPKRRVRNRNGRRLATIFVANLPFTANKYEIAAYFKATGEVIKVKLSRGYCHVEFATKEAAKRALEMKHEFMGRELILEMGTPKRKKKSSIHKGEDENTAVMMKDTPSLDKFYGKANSNEKEPETRVGNQNEHGMATILVANLPSIAIENDIAAFFKEAGEVIQVRLHKSGEFCHVEFATEEAAKRALAMKQEFMGREIRIDMAAQKVSSTHSSGQDNCREHGGSYRGCSGGRGRGHGGRGRTRY